LELLAKRLLHDDDEYPPEITTTHSERCHSSTTLLQEEEDPLQQFAEHLLIHGSEAFVDPSKEINPNNERWRKVWERLTKT